MAFSLFSAWFWRQDTRTAIVLQSSAPPAFWTWDTWSASPAPKGGKPPAEFIKNIRIRPGTTGKSCGDLRWDMTRLVWCWWYVCKKGRPPIFEGYTSDIRNPNCQESDQLRIRAFQMGSWTDLETFLLPPTPPRFLIRGTKSSSLVNAAWSSWEKTACRIW